MTEPVTKSLAEEVLRGDALAVSRAITHAENATSEGIALLKEIAPHVGQATRLGVTGPPGVGKSTLIDALAELLRKRGDGVGVVAVDPTSPFTGGALLGDRIRMSRIAEDIARWPGGSTFRWFREARHHWRMPKAPAIWRPGSAIR